MPRPRCGALLAVATLVTACNREPPRDPPEQKPQAKQGSADRAPAPLRKLWRESVRYRKSHEARARNQPSTQRDLAKLDRMLATVKAMDHCPLVKHEAADRDALQARIEEHLTRFAPGGHVALTPGPPPRRPPPEIALTTVGYDYSDDQIAGHHQVTISLSAREGPAFLEGLPVLGRLLEFTEAKRAGGRDTLVGTAPFFRSFPAVRFLRPRPDVDALIREAAGAEPPDGASAGTVARIRENYAAVDALEIKLRASLAVSGEVKVREGRWRFYKALDERIGRVTWRALTKEAGGKGKQGRPQRRGHPH